MRIALQPSSSKDALIHFEDTINNPVSTKLISSYAPPSVVARLGELFPEGNAAVWGVTPGKSLANVSKWDALSAGDLVLFARNKRLFAKGTVAAKFRNEELAEKLWGRDDSGMTWECVYLLTDVSAINIDQVEMNAALGYASNNVVQGFQVLTPQQSVQLDRALGLFSEVLAPDVSQAEFRAAVAPYDSNQVLDRDVQTKARIEQGFLRKTLFGVSRKGTCGICGKEYAVEFLRAAHIKARSHCTQDERLDAENIVMPMCTFGCDELYEKGHIGIKAGRVIRMKPLGYGGAAAEYVAAIENRRCELWSLNRAPYFQWHRERNGYSDSLVQAVTQRT